MDLYSTYNRSNAGTEALAHAMTQDGKPYIWGGTGPNGFDCSGLVQWAYSTVGVAIPRTTQEQYTVFQIAKSENIKLLPGDLLFIAGSDGTPTSPGHVMMYQSPGKVVQAPFTGENVGIYDYDTSVHDFVTRPANFYGPVIKGPSAEILKANHLVRLTTDAEATLALRNGWAIRGWNGHFFPVLPLQGLPLGVAKYAVAEFRTKNPAKK
jgi:hypothetical protein